MSHNNHAHIPPPTDYTPRVRPPQSTRSRGVRGDGGCGNRKRGLGHHSFHKDYQHKIETKSAVQPKDRFHRNEDDDYFARILDEEEEAAGEAEEQNKNSNYKGDDDDEDDPLDAYMKSLEGGGSDKCKDASESVESSPSKSYKLTNTEFPSSSTTLQEPDKGRGVRLDIDNTDDIEESYYQLVGQSRAKKSSELESEDSIEDKLNMVDYDKDGNVIGVRKLKREIDPLPPLDHSTIEYQTFEKIFYQQHAEIEKLTSEQEQELRAKLEIKVSGDSPPKPVCSFAHFKFDEQLMRVIRRSDYTQPTPIQAQAIPAALLGRNIIGIAVTGSGKTAAYLWPMIVHIMGQPDLKRGDGPIALVLVPTRELALQVYSEARKFSSSYKIAVVCAYGGGSKYEQSRDLEAGAEIVVATPGRLIDLIKMGVTNLRRVTYLVLDEADRFFEMGFEIQVRSICDHIRPDRQTLLFSATFKKRIEQLARTVTDNPVKIVQKNLGEANEDVTQHVIVLSDAQKKWDWLLSKLVEFTSTGSVLIFVTRILNSEELYKNLKEQGKETLLLHGDMEQSERNRVITTFKRKDKDIMIATDVAARGLDIAHIKTVINYDVARDVDTHTHRIGRTGRAGLKGDAYTLVTDKDKEFAGHLVKSLESSNQGVSEDLMKLAMQSHTFRKSRALKHNRKQEHSSSHHHHHHHHGDHRSHDRSHHHRYHNEDSSRSGHRQNYSHRHHQVHEQSSSNRSSGGQHRSGPDRGSTSQFHISSDGKRPRWN